jgi:calcium binding protein 39
MLLIVQEMHNSGVLLMLLIVQEMYNSGVLLMLLRNLHRIDFEGKKDAAQIFNNVLRRQIGTRTPTVEYICTTPDILFTLCKGKISGIQTLEVSRIVQYNCNFTPNLLMARTRGSFHC